MSQALIGSSSPRIVVPDPKKKPGTPGTGTKKNPRLNNVTQKFDISERLFKDQPGERTRRLERKKQAELEEEKRLEAERQAAEPSEFTKLQERRQQEYESLDFLGENRRVLRKKNAEIVARNLNNDYNNYLHKRISLPAETERELKSELKENYLRKEIFEKNRSERETKYQEQRKLDYATSLKRHNLLIEKLRSEFQQGLSLYLTLCKTYSEDTNKSAKELVSELSAETADAIIKSTLRLQEIADAVSFVPFFYKEIMPLFQANRIVFETKNVEIPDFQVSLYKTHLPKEAVSVFTTLLETFQPELMTPKIIARCVKAVCVISKPLVFSRDQSLQLAQEIGWKPVFVDDFKNPAEDVFTLLSTTTENIILFGFPRTPSELNEVYELFNPKTDNDNNNGILPKPVPSEVIPFDKIIELDIDDEIVLGDALAMLEDPQTNEKVDVRTIDDHDVHKICRLQPVKDQLLDIPQYPKRSVTLKSNFKLIEERYRSIYSVIKLESRSISQELVNSIKEIVDPIQQPVAPAYPPNTILPNLVAQLDPVTPELRQFFVNQWKNIENTYNKSVQRVFNLINETHLSMVEHLTKARKEMQAFLCRPGNSQHLVIEFQQWHCTQVERCMRRMQKVKDECSLRLNALREQLLNIETDRKAEEESKQKDLLNAPFRTTLFEIISNAYAMLAQAEIDRWTSTRGLMMDFNQVIIQGDLVAPLPHKKIPLTDLKNDKKKKANKQTRGTPTSRSRLDGKLPTYDLTLIENLENIKKFVGEASSIYVPVTAPTSTRAKARQTKDKNPLAPHRISAIEEFQSAFRDDDAYFVGQLDKVGRMAQDEVQTIQQAFDAFVEDSTSWISSHFERRKAIADTAIAYMQQKVNDELQLNQLIFFSEDKCTVDYTQLLCANEESPKIPQPFPEDIISEANAGNAEKLYEKISLHLTTPE